MTKTTAAILGVVTIGSAVMIVVGAFVFPNFVPQFEAPHQAIRLMDRLVLYSYATAIILVLAYMVYLFAVPSVPKEKRALWFFILLLGNVFAIPVFWYHYVWKVSGQHGGRAP